MALWDSVTNFFSDLGDMFSGKAFFEIAGEAWNDIMKLSRTVLLVNPTTGDNAATWESVTDIYTTLNVIAASLLVVFFLYGFCRDSIDIKTELTLDRCIKLFIRLIIVANLMEMALSWMPKFMTWIRKICKVILGDSKFAFTFDGAKIYDDIVSASGWGTFTAFMTSILFFLFTLACGFMVLLTILNRILKIYMIAPFAGCALSTLAAGGQASQVGFSYIKAFFEYVLAALLISVVILLSSSFISSLSFSSDSAILVLATYCLKMAAIATSVKGAEQMMQKAFGL